MGKDFNNLWHFDVDKWCKYISMFRKEFPWNYTCNDMRHHITIGDYQQEIFSAYFCAVVMIAIMVTCTRLWCNVRSCYVYHTYTCRRIYNYGSLGPGIFVYLCSNSCDKPSWWRNQMEKNPRYWPFVWGDSTGHRWIPLTKASDAELWCFLWSAPEQTVEQTIGTPVTLIMMSL